MINNNESYNFDTEINKLDLHFLLIEYENLFFDENYKTEYFSDEKIEIWKKIKKSN